IGKHVIEALRHLHRSRRVGNLDDVPADEPLALLPILVEVVVAKQEVRRVDAGITFVDAGDVELPGTVPALRGPNRRAKRHAVTDVPSEAVGRGAADDGTLTIGQPRLHRLWR